MRKPLPLLLVLCPFALAACQSPPTLPPEMPPDFLFSYTMERLDPGGTPPAEGEAEAGDPARVSPLVRSVYVEVRTGRGGRYDVQFFQDGPDPKQGTIDLDESDLEQVYAAVLETRFFRMDDRYEGDDVDRPKREYYVRSNSRLKNVVVEGTTVESLERMWGRIADLLLAEKPDLFSHSDADRQGFVIDIRNGSFHRADCPHVEEIPEEQRVYRSSAQSCLNYGAWPAEDCSPMGDR